MHMSNAPSRPDIHDYALRTTFDRVAPQIERFAENLDTVSSDIKSLEAYLERSALRIEISHKFASETKLAGAADEIDGSYTGEVLRYEEFIAWGEHQPSGRWRLIY